MEMMLAWERESKLQNQEEKLYLAESIFRLLQFLLFE